MTQIILPKTNQTGANEWADVEDNDKAIRDVVNGELENDNIASGAGITTSKLALFVGEKGYRINVGSGEVEIGEGPAPNFSLETAVAHGLGQVPKAVFMQKTLADGYLVIFDFRITKTDSTNFHFQLIGDGIPSTATIGYFWAAIG